MSASEFKSWGIVLCLGPNYSNMEEEDGQQKSLPIEEFKVYKKRWIILALFVLYSASNAFQWTQLVIITSILEKHYNVGTLAISWTSIIFMATYIPLIFPASWILQKKGLRKSILLGSLGTCLGSWIKVLATHPSSFTLLFSGQTIVAISQIFILGIPAQLAATWFPADQVSSACAIGVFGNQLGVALGFVLPASFIRSSVGSNFVTTQNDLFAMFMAVAIITTVLLIVIIFAFSDKPLNPPSPAQKAAVETLAEEDYLSSIKRLITNKNYILLLITYGLNVGVFYAVSTILNSVVVLYYKDAEVDAGRIGLVIVLCGMVGSMVCGIILDKTHAYKATTFAVYILTAMGMTIFTFTVNLGHIEIVYFTAGVLGFFMTGYLPIGFEFAAEITYPESEGTSSGLLNASAQIFGIICTLIAERLLEFTHKAFIPNGVLIIVLILGCILTGIIKPDYRRQKAAKNQVSNSFTNETIAP
nr:feline leukemia virus subgroup C receptor-related protein 2-like isoform X1 [Lepeophtheirus salmonis]